MFHFSQLLLWNCQNFMSFYHLYEENISTILFENFSSTVEETTTNNYEILTWKDTTTPFLSSMSLFVSEGRMFLYFVFVDFCLP